MLEPKRTRFITNQERKVEIPANLNFCVSAGPGVCSEKCDGNLFKTQKNNM